MPRRKAKQRRRNKFASAFNLRTAVLSYAGLAIFTQNILGASPYTVIAAGYLPGVAASGGSNRVITLNEVIAQAQSGSSLAIGEAIMMNVRENAGMLIIQSIGLKIADKLITSSGAARNFNKVVRQLGLGQVVKA